jgi:hypothetical protein
MVKAGPTIRSPSATKRREAGPRQGRVNLPEPIADRLDREMQHPHERGHDDQATNGAGMR